MCDNVSIFRRVGGKFRVKEKIIKFFPEFDTYVEPFAGSAGVFRGLTIDKDKKYVLNDLNTDIYDIWRDIKRISPEKFRKMNFNGDRETFYKLKDMTIPKTIEARLYRNLYLSYNSYQSIRRTYAEKGNKNTAIKLKNCIEQVQAELKHTTITHQDYSKCIKRWDAPTTLFYLDPPYFEKEHLYEGMAVNPYELSKVCSKIKGHFVLSYNVNPVVEDAFKEFNFHRLLFTYDSLDKKKQTNRRVEKYEYIITNY